MAEALRQGKRMADEIRLAIYDMDRTVTRRATYTPFLTYAALRLNPLRLLFFPLVGLISLGYTFRLLDRARLKEIMQALLLGPAVRPQRLASVVEGFAERTVAKNLRPGARANLAQDKADGYALVLATASYKLYVDAIAARLGFDHVIATGSLIGLDKRIIARIDGENCYGPGKMRMVLAWLRRQGIERERARIRFYSDHVSDAPLFTWADEPVAVNPHGPLHELARNMKWREVDWG